MKIVMALVFVLSVMAQDKKTESCALVVLGTKSVLNVVEVEIAKVKFMVADDKRSVGHTHFIRAVRSRLAITFNASLEVKK